MDYSEKKLVSIETQIIKSVIDGLLGEGYEIAVNGGEETTLAHTRDADTILEAMRTTDEDYLYVNKLGGHGWVRFIYGNDDVDVISDYTFNLKSIIIPITNMINKYEDTDRGARA